MKKILSLSAFLIAGIGFAFSQAPSRLAYQAVVRNSSGVVVPNGTNVGFRFTIRDGSGAGTILYQETTTQTVTNAFGQVAYQIGGGAVQQGAFPTPAQWSSGSKFLQVEVDPAGGSSYTDLGAVQLISVPYSQYANLAGSANTLTGSLPPVQIGSGGASNGQVLQWNGSSWVPATVSGGGGGDITDVIAGTGLSGGATSGSATLNATNTAAMWNANQLQGVNVSSGSVTNGDVLKFNGTAWAPAADNNTTYTAGTGLTLAGTTFNSVWTTSGNNIFNNNSGNVGIGTNAPADEFHLKGSSQIGRLEFANNSWLAFYKGTKYLGYLGNYNDTNGLEFGTNNSGPNDYLHLVTKATPRITVTGSGNVGIGTKSPTYMLQVHEVSGIYANVHFSSPTTGSGASDGLMIGHDQSDGTAIFWNWEDKDIFFGTNGNQRMRIKNDGKVGIGTSAPSTIFEVVGDVSTSYNGVGKSSNSNSGNFAFGHHVVGAGSGAYIEGTYVGDWAKVSGGAGQGWGQYSDVANTGNSYGVYGYAHGSATNYGLYCAGNGVYTGTWSSSSDAKLKKDINPIESGLATVMKLSPKSYYFRSDEPQYKSMMLAEGLHYGFIAQDLEKVIPAVVSQNYHSNPTEPGKVVEYKGVNYIELIPVLTQAIQEQQDQIEALKKEVEALKAANK